MEIISISMMISSSSQADRRPISNRHQYLISSNRISILHHDHDIGYKAHVDDHDHDVDANEHADHADFKLNIIVIHFCTMNKYISHSTTTLKVHISWWGNFCLSVAGLVRKYKKCKLFIRCRKAFHTVCSNQSTAIHSAAIACQRRM